MAKHFGDVKDAMKMFSDMSNTHKADNMLNEHNVHSDDIVSKANNEPNAQYISNNKYSHNDGNTSKTDIRSNTHNALNADDEQYVHNDDSASNEHKKETKSKRFSLLLRPSILIALNKIARMENNSPTDIINTVLEDYIQTRSDLIEKYDTLFDENGKPKL